MSKALSIAALAGMIGLSVFGNVGCAETAPPKKPVAAPPEHAVVVDFYTGSKVSSACSGTLISSNVVLTAAHCAEGSNSARVTSPATKQKALVKRIYRYDWRWGGSVEHHAVEHDLALVVLRTPIKIQKYASLESSECTGCKISRVGRVRTKSSIRPTLKSSSVMRIGKNHPAERPFELYVPRGSMDAGGALVRTDAKGRGRVVGVMIGTGGLSHGGYAARLDEAPIQAWIRGITYSVRLKSTTSSATKSTNIRPLDADEETEAAPEPEEAPADEPAANDNETTTPTPDTNPYEDSPSSTSSDDQPQQQQQQQQQTNDEPQKEEPAQTNDEEPKKEPNEQAEAPEKEDVKPGGQTNNPGEVDNSETTATDETKPDETKPDETKPDETKPDETKPDETKPEETKPDEEKKAEDDKPTTKVDGADQPDKTYEDPALKSGTDKKGFAYTDTDNAAVRFKTDNPADRDIKQRVDSYAENNKKANVISTHGSPGWMEAPPTDKKLQEFGSNGKPIVMASCFAAEPPTNGGKTNAQSVAEKSGTPPENVYGCNGVVGPDSNAMRCDGTWRDATGKELSPDQRQQHGLQNCTQVPTPGKPGYVNFTCQPN